MAAGELISCKVKACTYFNSKGALNCSHETYSKQDVRPGSCNDCRFFEANLELIFRKGVYFIRNRLINKEVKFDRESSGFSTEGQKRLDIMAEKLQVRRKDVFAVSLIIKEEELTNDDDKSPDMEETLNLLNTKFIFKCPTDTRELLGYDGEGQYIPFECKVHEVLEETYGDVLKSYFVEETIKHLQRANYVERKEINKFTTKIPLQNGLFNFETHELEPFDPDQIYTYKLNVRYDPEAKCPIFDKFVNQILRKEDVPVLQEIMGYTTYPGMPYHLMFWFYGKGRNGKGRIVLTLIHILGRNNCSQLNISEFKESRRFALSRLYGKLLNVSSEPTTKYPIQTNVLKMMCGEDPIDAELKGKNKRLKFTNVSKEIVLGNRFPRIEDPTPGCWERISVLEFPFMFTVENENMIPNIEQTWLSKPKEVSGIFNWMLEGFYRLRKNNGLSTTKTTKDIKAEFMRLSDPFKAWLMNNCTFRLVGKIEKQEAYENYKEFCYELGVENVSKNQFFTKLRDTPRVAEKQKRTPDGKRPRYFVGITLKNLETDDLDGQETLDVTAVSAVTTSHNPETNEDKIKRKVSDPVTAVTTVTKSKNQIPKGPILIEKTKTSVVPGRLTDFNIIKCLWQDDPSVGKCANCKDIGTLPYRVENTKKESGFVCKRCGEFFLELIEKQQKVD